MDIFYDDIKRLDFEDKVNNVFTFVLYIFFIEIIEFFLKTDEKEKGLFFIKLFGSAFLIGGALCLIYFQINQTDIIGTSAI